jgi:hypothetical protein
MPYTTEYFIGFGVFTFWIGVAFLSAGLLNATIDAPDAGNARYLRSPYTTPIEAREPIIYGGTCNISRSPLRKRLVGSSSKSITNG